jgi:hypothetical protein
MRKIRKKIRFHIIRSLIIFINLNLKGLERLVLKNSLRISILSNKSEELDFNKSKLELYKLQRTREMNRLSSLIASGALEERKNQSETLNVANIFKRLLDEGDDFNNFIIDQNKNIESKEQKIFEYHPQNQEPKSEKSENPDEKP